MKKQILWWLAAFATVMSVVAVIAINPIPTGAEAAAPGARCAAEGSTLSRAKTNYSQQCNLPRVDCDPTGGGWVCSSDQIGNGSPLEVSTTTTPTGPCTATGNTLSRAISNYRNSCSQPRRDCDPSGGGWICSSENIGGGSPAPAPSPNPSPNPTPSPMPGGGDCGVIPIEAESLSLVGAWKTVNDGKASGGSYITWEGLSREANNNSPADTIRVSIQVGKTGTYRFTWAMRQPSDVAGDKANDTWVNFPDAARFGPTGGGSYGGFMKVYGNAKGDFKYAAKAEKNHNFSDIAIEFRSPGTYTMEIAGRSHGHQIDRIVLYHDSIGQSQAIASNGCGGNPTPAPNPTPNPTPAPNPDGGQTGVLGRFDRGEDILLCNYDSKPDEDDLHAVAGLGTMLRSPKINGINYHCTAGAYGKQNGTFLNEPRLFDLAFGSGNWASAHNNRTAAVNLAADKAISALDGGGDVWVSEAGQSDVTARIVKRIQSLRPNVNTKQRIHVVQHSDWNENQTTASELSFTKNNTDYRKIADGNGANNGTPQLLTRSSQYWSRAKNNANVGAIWTEADAAAKRGFSTDWNNGAIVDGGMDFSDTVEPMYIFGYEGRGGNVGGFFDEFLTNTPTPTPNPTPAPAPSPAPTPTPAPTPGGACTASGSTLGQAQQSYANKCSQPRKDCDPSGGGWICSSENIGGGGTPAPAPNPSPSPNPSPNGSALPPAPAGFKWVRVDAVSDEFNGSSLDRYKWLNDHPFWNGREPSQFRPANVSVGGGNLQLKSTVANRNQQGNWVHSAAVTSNTKVGQGYYEARIKASRISMTSSFWFQTSGGPRHEIDVVENVGAPRKNPNDARVMHSNSHYNYGRPNAISTPKRWTMPSGAGDTYHTYGVWWKSEREIWLYHNGTKVNEIRTGGPFNADQHMFFDTEVFSWVGNPTVAGLDDNNRNTMYVDWVRGWQLVRS